MNVFPELFSQSSTISYDNGHFDSIIIIISTAQSVYYLYNI